jgi:carboxyl-terminal processing protease
MRLRLFPILALTLLIAGALGSGVAVAQSDAPRLSVVAQSLTKYALVQADLPAGVRFVDPIDEVSNEDAVAADPDFAALVQKWGRVTEITQSLSRRAGPGSISVGINLMRDADGAWGDALDSTFPADAVIERTVPGPAVGERSVVFHYTRGTETRRTEAYYLIFQRDRLEVAVGTVGPVGSVSLDEVLPLALVIDAKIVAAPPGPITAAEQAEFDAGPAAVVRGAIKLLHRFYVEDLSPDVLFTEAWTGATDALRRAGVTNPPPPPLFPRDLEGAIAVHMQRFPELERLAAGRLSNADLAYAAINELVNERDDCHTYHYTPEQWRRSSAESSGAELPPRMGFAYRVEWPLRITDITPGSPAKAAGMRSGQTIVAVNGFTVTPENVRDAPNHINRGEGQLNVFVVQNPSGRTEEIRVAPARFRVPPLEAEVLPGNIGLLRFYVFQNNDEQLRLMRRALEEFEAKGVQGWIIDLRQNPGGSRNLRVAMSSLFLQDGRVDGTITRGRAPVYTEVTGNALPFQRPLVFLVGPNSASAGEILPASLALRGRAVVVGQTTAGCVGSTTGFGLLDGSALFVTRTEYVLGPDDVRLHRHGLRPAIEAQPPTDAQAEYGVDPQLEAALQALSDLINGRPAPTVRPVGVRQAPVLSF